MRLLLLLVKTYPGQTVVVLFALLLVALAEGINLMALIPLLGVIVSQETGASEAPAQMMAVEKEIRAALDFVGLPATPGVLMVGILLAMVAKCVLGLRNQLRGGYPLAQMTIDLRLRCYATLLSVALFVEFPAISWCKFGRSVGI